MKNALVAVVCTLAAVGCGGENRPAQDPTTATTSTSVTTETSTTTGAARNPSSGSGTAATPSMANGRETTGTNGTGANGSGANAANNSAANGNSGATAPVTAPSTNGDVAVANNPGAANHTDSADNTKVNDRDRHGALTPMDQGGGKDRDITAAIRRSVVGDKALSFTAKNVKIITNGGKVTLRGPVNSDAERASIEAKAKSTTGVSEVDNQLEVKK